MHRIVETVSTARLAYLGQKSMLELVVGAKHNGGRGLQAPVVQPVRKIAAGILRCGQWLIRHHSQRYAPGAGNRLRAAAKAGGYVALAHAPQSYVLVFYHHVQKYSFFGTEVADGRGPPGCEAVGIERDAKSSGWFGQGGNGTGQVAFQQAHLMNMIE